MKKIIIGTIVATIIFFSWQSLAWMMLPVHKETVRYTDKQMEILD
jgi:hypothetical protein